MSNLLPEESYAAEQLKDLIEAEETEAPNVNIESDYKRAQEFSISSKDDDSAKFDSINKAGAFSNQSEEFSDSEEGNPENFMEMAQEISSKIEK
jgi:hypothetical protein